MNGETRPSYTPALALLALALLAGCPAPVPPADAPAADAPVVDTPPTDIPDAPVVPDTAQMDATAMDPVPYRGVDDFCPGSPHCTGMGADDRLYVGVGRELINPTLTETMWTDTNMNGLWNTGEPFMDLNGNGRFDAQWMAGFSSGRPATGQHTDLEVRAIAFRNRDTTVALAVLDTVGYFIDDMDLIRRDPMLAGLDIDKVVIASTHTHEGVDTVGLWGSDVSASGRTPEYMQLTRERTARAIRAAVMSLRPARMRVAQFETVDPATGSTLAYVNDTRDPVLFDPTVTVVHFVEADTPTRTIGTWINWASHPEYSGSRNTLLSADYVHYIRRVTEMGTADGSVPGVGGTTVFLNGALGGQVGPGGTTVVGEGGMPLRDSSLAKAEALGRNVGRMVLERLASSATEATETTVAYRTAPIFARADNFGYCLLRQIGVLDRELFNYDRRRACGPTNTAWVRSRVTYLQVGPVGAITAPGELHPELWIGFDMRWSFGQPVLTATENRPDLSRAPMGPYLRDVMRMNPGVRYAIVAGLTEDFLGYIVPAYNFVLHPTMPYVGRAAGDHYEETNSLGPLSEDHLWGAMMSVARWRPGDPVTDAGVPDR